MTQREQIEINAAKRKSGKGPSGALRRSRYVPAVVYGPKMESMTFCMAEGEAIKYGGHKFENTIFVLKSDDSKLNGLKVLRKDMDVNPVTRRPVHLDFYAIDVTQTVRVNVELKFEGKPAGVVNDGGVFNAVRREIEVETLPTDIPEFFEVDVSGLELNAVLHVSDLNIPANTKIVTPENLTIATVAVPKEEEAAAVAPAEGEAAAATGEAAAPAAGGTEAKKE